jgi:hypothetical protein
VIINIYAAYFSDDAAAAELLPAAAEPTADEPPPVEVPPSACAYACSNSINPTAVDSIASTANAIQMSEALNVLSLPREFFVLYLSESLVII